jgi:outer membrane lipoprotein-sorting protein
LISGMSCPPPKTFSWAPRKGAVRRRGGACRALWAAVSLWTVGMTVCAHAQGMTLDSILALFAQRQHGHVMYSEEVDSALLERPLHTSGELFFDAPDRLEKRTLQPVAQQLIAEGDQLTFIRGRHRSSMRLSDYPQLSPLLNGLRATLAGDRATLEKNFQLALSSSGSDWTIRLQPLASEAKPPYKHIEIRGSEGEIRGVTLERANGERTIMTLTEPAQS